MKASNGTLWQAIRGPILLITLGSLLALDHFGPYAFWRTWPALLIVFGALKLMERVAVRTPAGPSQQGGFQP